MASGLLTGKWSAERVQGLPETDWRRKSPLFQEPRLSRNLALADLLAKIGARSGHSAGEVAIAWTLHHPAVTAAIVGGRRPSQVEETVGASDLQLSDQDITEIQQFVQTQL